MYTFTMWTTIANGYIISGYHFTNPVWTHWLKDHLGPLGHVNWGVVYHWSSHKINLHPTLDLAYCVNETMTYFSWVLQCLDNVGQDSQCSNPPCAIVPLGTGTNPELQRRFFKDLCGGLCNGSIIGRKSVSIRPVVYPESSYKIMDPVSASLSLHNRYFTEPSQNLRREFVAILVQTFRVLCK